MASLVTKQFSYHAAKAFANSFLADSIYLYLGKPDPWTDETSADTPVDTHLDHISIWNNMAGAARIPRNDVAVGVKRINWATGMAYEKYNDSISTLNSGNGYYVLAGPRDRCVYKCLDNNGNAASTVKPSHNYINAPREADGYAWKYMYEISDADFRDFATANVMPVPTREGTSASPSGSILNIPIPANNLIGIGYNYRGSGFSNGTLGVSLHPTANIKTAVTSAINQLVIQSDQGGLPDENDFYNNCSVMLTSGPSRGKIYNIIDWQQSPKRLWLSSDVGRVDAGDLFTIGPKVTIDADGAGLTAIGIVNGYGNVTSIDVSTIGSGYSNVRSITIENKYDPETVDTSANGVGAYANVYVPPFSGHGFNPAAELQAKYVIVSAKLPMAGGSNDGDGYFAGYGQDYRQFGLLRNPRTTKSTLARGMSYDLRTHLYFDSTVVSYAQVLTHFPANTVVTNANTGATGVVWNHPDTGTHRHLTLMNVVGNSGLTFSNGQYITGSGGSGHISSANADQFLYQGNPPISSVLYGQLAKYSGEIIYHENISPINRHKDQHENFKLVFEF